MDFKELHKKYQELLIENNNLKEEIKSLKAKIIDVKPDSIENSVSLVREKQEETIADSLLTSSSIINKRSNSDEKIRLYMSLFRGREDIYAKRWENKSKGTAGYSPVCANEWKPGICQKPKIKCSNCRYKEYLPLNEQVIEDHLSGRNNLVAGIYPMNIDETCWFLAIDFDNEGWQRDISTIREVCSEFKISLSVEKSRSGNGAHAWFFFESPVSAFLARKFGSAMLTCAMNKRHEIAFKSYDRFFPNQDTMPQGGFGNLIALPLQKVARKSNNSVFIDDQFRPLPDQWEYLASIKRISEANLERCITELCQGSELGTLKEEDEEDNTKPWEKCRKIKLSKDDFPNKIEIIKANMLYVPKSGFTQAALNHLKRLAAFKNPEFYKAQAMRLPTFDKPRIISCSDDKTGFLCLPRGCENDLKTVMDEFDVEVCLIDKTNSGKKIDVEFVGRLRDEQLLAVNKLLEHDNGILYGTTAFGKTVASIKLIAERKVNTLIIVDKINLLTQWKERLTSFLKINETLQQKDELKNKKKNHSIIGEIGGGKNILNGIIDIAVMQSLNRMGEIKDYVKNYGMVIVDECHHVSAFSFEMILKNVNSKYVYGLTATPVRKDGHHPIIFMQCGPVRYRDDALKQAEKRPFEHYVVPKFTSFRLLSDDDDQKTPIYELYSEIAENKIRNQLITDNVVQCHENGRNCIVLTERTLHVRLLTEELGKRIPDVIAVTGSMGTKDARETMVRIKKMPLHMPLTIVATGRYIGEGFDEPRLDTLFLVMPISWKGTLQQYAGRLHRLYEGKKDVRIYDFVDIHVKMFDKMYHKRLNGYASIGYKVKAENITADNIIDIIYNKSNFLPVFSNDIINATREVLIVSPFLTKRRTLQMTQFFRVAITKGVKVIVVTRPSDDFKDLDLNTWQVSNEALKESGVRVVFKSNIHQKFAVADQKVVWYGSINLLSYGSAEESIMRIESVNIANELIKSIEQK